MTTSIDTQTAPGTSTELHEKALLACILGAEDPAAAYLTAAAHVAGHEFANPGYREVFETIGATVDRGTKVSIYSIGMPLENSPLFAKIGGENFLRQASFGSGGVRIDLTAQNIRRAAEARQATRLLQQAASAVAKDGVLSALSQARTEMDAFEASRTDTDSDLLSADDLHTTFLDNLYNPKPRIAYTTGLIDLDDAIGGLRPKQMVTVAAPSGGGKSLLGLNIARAVARKGFINRTQAHPVLFVSLEMSAEELEWRRVAATAKVELSHLVNGWGPDSDPSTARSREDDVRRIEAKSGILFGMPLKVWEPRTEVTIPMIKAYARKMEREYGAMPVIVVDYIQLISPASRRNNRQEEVQSISRDAKLMAKELNTPVVMLAQMNRGPAQRADKRPQTSDIRESGGILNDSDVVLMLYREYAYEPSELNEHKVEIIVGKNRNGRAGVAVEAKWEGHYSRIVNLSSQEKADREQEKAQAAAKPNMTGNTWGD